MQLTLDHILWAGPDLDAAVQQFAMVAGVEPRGGGSHPGFGTRNQLLSLGQDLFFEIIGPDPEQDDAGQRAGAIAQMAFPAMHAFCVRSNDLASVADRARIAGLDCQPPVAMSRTRSDGVRLAWEILYLSAPEWGDLLPFVIDWQGSPHPAGTSPTGCSLLEFTALSPRADELATLYGAVGIPVDVRLSPRAGFLTRLATPNGEVVVQ